MMVFQMDSRDFSTSKEHLRVRLLGGNLLFFFLVFLVSVSLFGMRHETSILCEIFDISMIPPMVTNVNVV